MAQTALADAYEKNKYYTLEKLCDYIDTQHQYFKTALEAVEATRQKVDDYRRFIAKVFITDSRDPERHADVCITIEKEGIPKYSSGPRGSG